MPYISVSTQKKLTENKKDALAQELCNLITIIPGKEAKDLMIGINDGYTFYFGDMKLKNGVFLDIRCFGQAEKEYNAQFVEEVFLVLERLLGTPKEQVYMNLSEHHVWGAQGKFIAE